jgi:hypothetical protein
MYKKNLGEILFSEKWKYEELNEPVKEEVGVGNVCKFSLFPFRNL